MAFVVPAIASVLGGIGSAAAAGVGAVGSAAAGLGTAAAGLGSAASMGTLLQGGVSMMSMLQSMGGADATEAGIPLLEMQGGLQTAMAGLEAARYGVEAEGINLDAELTRLDAERAALTLRRDLGKQIGAQRVAFAASGVDPTSGTAMQLSSELKSNVDKDIQAVRGDAAIAARTKKIAAEMTRSGATAARVQSVMEGLANQSRISQLATQAQGQRVDGMMTAANFLGDFLMRGV